MAQSTSGKPIFTAPLTCPLFPGYAVAPIATIHALAVHRRVCRLFMRGPTRPPQAGTVPACTPFDPRRPRPSAPAFA